ncbi:hypothetical protein QYR02_02460 [Microbacterium maritypicum]|uniref:hypothetical protein n=1 Tax=Microbacterium maritypicum TaxID=33918 RepID=UPI002672F7B9|nr:hypothetical protein [Microbacterium liquefaciens]WKT89796.1 hypothetical protein QYR02_02460 [Microbacterium liquefaciens]
MTTQEAGLFSRVDNTRAVKGLLLPFGELSRPNLSKTEPVMFSATSVSIPRDPSAVTLNDEHDRFNPIGRATALEVTDAGVVAEFTIFNTDEGDAYLENPTKRKLSAELGSLMRAGTKAVRSRLTGAAVCTEGAFASAALFSLAPGVSAEFAEEVPSSDEYSAPESSSSSEYTTEFTDSEGVRWRRVEKSVRETTVTQISDSAPADEDNPEDSKEETMTASTAGQTPAPLVTPDIAPPVQDVDLHAVFSAMANIKNGVQIEDNESALFALADITTTGAGALPAAGVIQPAWVGKLWQGKEYVRKYLPLNNHTFGPIDLGGRAGFRLDQGTALVQERTTGEKKELPTGSATTSRRESTRKSFGYAADVAAEWSYLSGGAEVLESFWKGVANSYAKVTDLVGLASMFRVASRDTGAALSRMIAPGSLPAGTPANSAYYPGIVQLIQAIEAISDADDDPSWAVVNPVLWQQLIFTPKDLLPEFISLAVGVGTGEANADGKITVRKAPQSAFIGTKATDPQVIAGAKNAIEFKELGTTPIQIEALNVAKFGVDRATVGFLEEFVVRPEATVFIGTAA